MRVCTGPTLIGAQLDYPFPHLFPTYLLSSWLLSKKKKIATFLLCLISKR